MDEMGFAPESLWTHAGFVRSLARALLADETAAEDVAQETLLAALQHPPRRAGSLRPWLGRIARNLARQRWRGDARRAERERAAARGELGSHEALLAREEILQRVVTAVRALGEPQRTAVLLRFYEGLPPRAIARRTGVSVDAVNARLKRGLARLRLALGRDARDWRPALALLVGSPSMLVSGAGPTAALITALKTKTALACLAVLLLGLGSWHMLGGRRAVPAAPIAPAPRLAESGPAAEAGPSRRLEVAGAEQARLAELSGRVIDEQGRGIAGAEVHVLDAHDPFGPHDAHPQVGWNDKRGRTFTCDGEGRWSAQVPLVLSVGRASCGDCHEPQVSARHVPGRVLVTPRTAVGYEPVSGLGDPRWVQAPASGVDLVVRRIPTGVIEVRAVEGASRRPLEDFRIAVHGGAEVLPDGAYHYTRGFGSARAQAGLVRYEVRVEEPEGRRLFVVLSSPEVGGLWSRLFGADEPQPAQEVLLHAGETREVLLVLPERGVVQGFVVDEQGAPIPGALVFFGDRTVGRGDEPFRSFRAEKLEHPARSAADGWFELRGDGPQVSAWHHSFSEATVAASAAGRIVLGKRGAIRGRLLGAGGQPLEGVTLTLDRGRREPTSTSDASGRFAFEVVEAGAHALLEDGRILAAVRLEPGEELELELERADGALVLEFAQDGRPFEVLELEGALVGLERVFGMHEIERQRPASADAREPETGSRSSDELLTIRERVLPGRYLLLTRQGWVSPVTVAGNRAEVELGPAELIVRTQPGCRLQAVPADADPFVRLMGGRVPVMADEEGVARFRLHPGRVLLVGEAGAVLGEVSVSGGRTELALD